MIKTVRSLLFLVSAIQLAFAVAFFRHLPWATNLWPFPGTTPLTFIFVSSFFAAAAASTFWVAASENYGALAGVGLDYLGILTPMAIFALQLGARSGNTQLTVFGIQCALGALFGLGLLRWSIRIPLDRTLPLPRPVLWSFVVFIIALLLVSARLVRRLPTIPWAITPDLSVIMGWMFFGAAVYFAYALLRPGWLNAAGQLAGFLAYDIVLIVPFLTRLATVAAERRAGLMIYTAIVAYSGLLAIYYLFLRKSTRVWSVLPSRADARTPAA